MAGGAASPGCRRTKEERKPAWPPCPRGGGGFFLYRDVGRLGPVGLLEERGGGASRSRIGPEPLEETFTPFVFAERLQGTRAAVKKAIMDQRRLAGVGNIYANEALFRSEERRVGKECRSRWSPYH